MAAEIALAGMDPMGFLLERDEQRRVIMQAVARAASEMRKIEFNNLAVQITENVGKMLGAK